MFVKKKSRQSGTSLLRLLILLLLLLSFCSGSKAEWQGMVAPDMPEQIAVADLPAFRIREYDLQPLARYRVRAVVLSKKDYRRGRAAELSPVDLALGWGRMSLAAVINQLQISQSGRWYHYKWKDQPPLPQEEIISSSANTHCIPRDRKIHRALLRVKKYDLVELEGFLVTVSAADGFSWRSSLSRRDSGDGSCELLLVTKIFFRRLK